MTVIGVLLVLLGLYLLKTIRNPAVFLLALPYVSIGVGCGLFGHGMGSLISRKALQGDPALQKQLEIDARDERNVAIANRAKGKAFDCMTFVLGALMVSFALMRVPMIPFCYWYLFICFSTGTPFTTAAGMRKRCESLKTRAPIGIGARALLSFSLFSLALWCGDCSLSRHRRQV